MCVCVCVPACLRACVRGRCLTSSNPHLHLCLSVSEGPRQLFDLMCFPDDLSVFTPGSVQSAKNRHNSHSQKKNCILSFLACLLLFLRKHLPTFFFFSHKCACLRSVLVHLRLTIFVSHLASFSSPSLNSLLISALSSYCSALQSSEPVEGSGPAGSGVPWSAPRGGRVPHSAQIQERPCSKAQDSPPRTVPAAASGWPLPHRGVP